MSACSFFLLHFNRKKEEGEERRTRRNIDHTSETQIWKSAWSAKQRRIFTFLCPKLPSWNFQNRKHMQILLPSSINQLRNYWIIRLRSDSLVTLTKSHRCSHFLIIPKREWKTGFLHLTNTVVYFPDVHASTLISLFLFMVVSGFELMNEPEKNAESSEEKKFLVLVIKTQEKKCFTFAHNFGYVHIFDVNWAVFHSVCSATSPTCTELV